VRNRKRVAFELGTPDMPATSLGLLGTVEFWSPGAVDSRQPNALANRALHRLLADIAAGDYWSPDSEWELASKLTAEADGIPVLRGPCLLLGRGPESALEPLPDTFDRWWRLHRESIRDEVAVPSGAV
jgi:hypothetical protein